MLLELGADVEVDVDRWLMVFIVVVVFCLLPLHVLILLTDYQLVDSRRLAALAYVSLYMFAVNSAFNAVVVAVVSHEYRRRVLDLLGVVTKCRRRRGHGLQDVSDWTRSRARTSPDDRVTSFSWHSTRV